MPKVREKNIITNVIGYIRPRYGKGDSPRVRVDFSGTLPKGNISGVANVYLSSKEQRYSGVWDRDGVELTGDGRYSFMIGSSSAREPETIEFRNIAKKVAAEWVANNPNALYEARLQWAREDLEAANKQRDQTKQALDHRIAEAQKAQDDLQSIINERDPGR